MFTLKKKSRVSAGVFEQGTNNLVKTLFNYILYAPGVHPTPTWDGTDVYGNVYSGPATEVKVIASNVHWEWERSGIGNNSKAEPGHRKRSGLNIHANFQMYRDACLIGDILYVTCGYAEGNNVVSAIDITRPHRRVEMQPQLAWMPGCDRIATDGTHIYMFGGQAFDLLNNDGFDTSLSASLPKDLGRFENYLPFQGDTSHYSIHQWPATDVEFRALNAAGEEKSTECTGLSVQTTGDLVATARGGFNQLNILDKITGLPVTSHTITSIELLQFDDNGHLYYVSDNDLYKADIDAQGALANTTLVATGNNLLSISLDPTTNTVVVADRTATQGDIIKAYDTTTFNLTWDFGRKESYLTDPTVYDDKFMFISAAEKKGERTFVVFTSTGGMIVGDQGNQRYQFFDVNRNLTHSVMFQQANYHCIVAGPNNSRLMSEGYEFSVDWDKQVMPHNENDMWRLEKNWMMQLYALPLSDPDPKRRLDSFVSFCQLSNGRYYFIRRDSLSREQEIMEVLDTSLRQTGVFIQDNDLKVVNLRNDGIVRYSDLDTSLDPDREFHYEIPITGFDGSNNPIFGAKITHSSHPVTPLLSPKNFGFRPANHVMLGDSRVVFKAHKLSVDDDVINYLNPYEGDFHLGIIDRGATDLRSVFYESVIYPAGDPYPQDGTFDARSSVRNAAASSLGYGTTFITDYIGEFWEAGQVNQRLVWHESGLMIGAFGADFLSTGKQWRPEEHAGNSLSSQLIEHRGSHIIIHCDEQHQAQIHVWRCHNPYDFEIFNLQ